MQDCVAQSPLIPTILAIVMVITTLQLLFPTLIDSMWIFCHQLFFSCTLKPLTARVDRYNNSPDDIPLDLHLGTWMFRICSDIQAS